MTRGQLDSPDWVRDAGRQFLDEVRLFVRTALDVTLRPARFGAEWVRGERRALNPLGFLATAFAVLGPSVAVLKRLVHRADGDASMWIDALGALLPFAYYLLFGAVQHGFLRACGSRRRLRESCAMALYAGGGPGLIAHLFVLGLVLVVYWRWGVTDFLLLAPTLRWILIGLLAAPFLLFYVTLGRALAALHGARAWQVVIANVVALAVTALLFALLDPPGSYGLHVTCGPRFQEGAWHFVFGVNLTGGH